MKIIIAGTKYIADFDFVNRKLTKILSNYHNGKKYIDLEVVSGGSEDLDILGDTWATLNKVPVKVFPAVIDIHKSKARKVLNTEMLEYADLLIVFVTETSTPTDELAFAAEEAGLTVRRIKYA